LPTRPASGDFAVKDLRGMQMITVASQQGGDVLYVIEPSSAKVLVLAFNPNTKDLRRVAAGDLNQAFNVPGR
jgi:ribosomal 30S subunit maturation factor RimM